MIGALGDITFKTSFDGKKIENINFKNLKSKNSSNFEEHKRRGAKPLLEFINTSTTDLSFDILLLKTLGVNPVELLKKIKSYVETGEVLDFLLGEEVLGSFFIASYDSNLEYISNRGSIDKIEVSITLREYIEEIESNIQTIEKKKSKTTKKIVHEDFNQGAISQ